VCGEGGECEREDCEAERGHGFYCRANEAMRACGCCCENSRDE
jgi:hypothetical protein